MSGDRIHKLDMTVLGLPTQEMANKEWLSDPVPNPASSSVLVWVGLPVNETAELHLLDALGRVVKQLPVKEVAATASRQLEISVAGCAPGLYFLRLQTNSGAKVRRLVVTGR